MCRFHQLWGSALLALGVGILLGPWLQGDFLRSCLGLGLVAAGLILLKKQCPS